MDPSPSSVLDGLGSSLISMPDNNVSDANIKSAVVVDIALGVALMGLFVILQARSILYKIRLVSPYVSLRPPPLPTGVSALWAWLVAAAGTSDAELLESCGLDAMMLAHLWHPAGGPHCHPGVGHSAPPAQLRPLPGVRGRAGQHLPLYGLHHHQHPAGLTRAVAALPPHSGLHLLGLLAAEVALSPGVPLAAGSST
ncbi:uncharacterized protein HaLaN_00969, partial [Haematococcus lacustris]